MRPGPILALIVLTAACGQTTPAVSFTVDVTPPEAPQAVRAAIPGERTSFLVSIVNPDGRAEAALVSATATHATVDRVLPERIRQGQVAEIWLTIDPNITEDTTATVAISVTSGDTTRTVDRTIMVSPMSGEGRERDARPHFDYWTGWLAAIHPELGIDARTAWEPMYVSTLLIVSHMAYFSDEWELSLAWHAATIPPHDWSQIYLRKRATEAKPSLAFKLDSFSGHTPPYVVTPPEVVVR